MQERTGPRPVVLRPETCDSISPESAKDCRCPRSRGIVGAESAGRGPGKGGQRCPQVVLTQTLGAHKRRLFRWQSQELVNRL